MKDYKNTSCKWVAIFVSLFLLSIVSVIGGFQLPGAILSDSFHYGEYFASLTPLFGNESSFHPLRIHGALDYIPGLVAKNLFGNSKYYFPTWLIYKLLDYAAQVLLLIIAIQLTKNNSHRLLLLLGIAIAAPFLVGCRDFVLLIAIYLYFFIQGKHNSAINLVLEIIFGLVIALGLFWSFDRGIAGAIALGAASIIYASQDRKYITALITFIVAVSSFGYFLQELSLDNYWENIKFLAATSSNWSFGWQRDAVILTAFLGLLNILVNWLLWSSIIKAKIFAAHSANAVFLSTLSLILFKLAINRADLAHIYSGLWTPILISIYLLVNKLAAKPKSHSKVLVYIALIFILIIIFKYDAFPLYPIFIFGVWYMISVSYFGFKNLSLEKWVSAALLVPIATAIYLFPSGAAKENFSWINYYRSLPSNSMMVTDGVRWVSQELTNSESRCVLDLSNNGVINGLTGLPACTRFTYLIYADQRYEVEIINTVRSNRPNAIVYSSTFSSFNIDGKSMHARFPVLIQYLLENYPIENCTFGYCVRYREIIQ